MCIKCLMAARHKSIDLFIYDTERNQQSHHAMPRNEITAGHHLQMTFFKEMRRSGNTSSTILHARDMSIRKLLGLDQQMPAREMTQERRNIDPSMQEVIHKQEQIDWDLFLKGVLVVESSKQTKESYEHSLSKSSSHHCNTDAWINMAIPKIIELAL